MVQSIRTPVPQLYRLDKFELGTRGMMEAAYGTALDTGEIASNFLLMGEGVITERPLDLVGADDQIGDGFEFSKTPIENRRDLRFSVPFYLSSEIAAIIIGLAFGDLATTDASPIFTHALTLFDESAAVATGNAGHSQPAITSARIKSGPTQFIAHGLIVESFEIALNPGAVPIITVNFIGSGEVTVDANGFQSPATVNVLRLTNYQVGVAASEESIVKSLIDGTFKYTNNPDADAGYIPGSDIYRGQCLMGQRDYEHSTTIREHSTAVEDAAKLAQTAHKAIITFEGDAVGEANHTLILTLLNLRVAETSKGVSGVHRTVSPTYKAYGDASGNLLTGSVINAESGAYLTLDV